MNFTTNVYRLTQKFIDDYPEELYPELMYKLGRPYSCLLIDNHSNYYICIPFRSHINHKNAFLFYDTKRSIQSKSGLDYTKIVIINKVEYIDDKNVVVDQDEYNEVQKNIAKIVTDVVDYIDTYINHITGVETLHPKQFMRKYQFSTLVYFHDILQI